MTLVVGLTGGIGSGKSTAAHMFADLGAPIIDTDAIAHDLVQPGSVALVEIAARFGESVLGADGALDRKRLRQLVFADPSKRIQLEGILHPLIRARVAEELKTITAPYCILVVPLLFESGWDDAVDRILVVDVPESVQLARTMQRDGLTAAEVGAIMQAQTSREARLARATDVINNDCDAAYLAQQIRRLHEKYQRSGSKNRGIGSEQV